MSDGAEKNNKRPGKEKDRPTASFSGSAPGEQIGPFRIEQELGRGAMGVVYLAHDTKLDRPVAIKSLPAEVMANSKARSRFTREARLLASVNHPNIATIHEVLEEAEDVAYLILEYIPGQTLAERIAKKPLKLEEALSIALQIADAVAAAHEHDVIHRDLKPGNIKITPEGKVKVLDFGLAKAVGGEAADQQSTVTEPGRVIGTPAYMSPEQARGKPADKRSDIWSFGCVLYEMLTATVPFKGETISDTLARILEHEPEWNTLPEATSPNIRILLRRCLEKDPRQRLQHIGDARLEILETIRGGSFSWPAKDETKHKKFPLRQVMLWCMGAAVIGAAAAGAFIWIISSHVEESLSRNVITLSAPLAENTSLFSSRGGSIAFSPDEKYLAYVAVGQDDVRRLYLRHMGKATTSLVPGTEGAFSPFFRPDGQWIAFFAEDRVQGKHELKRVRIRGTELLEPEVLCMVPPSSCGGTWESNDRIIYSPIHHQNLVAISVSSKEQEIFANIDMDQGEYGHTWPCVLPKGNGVLFTASMGDPFTGLKTMVKWKGQEKLQELLGDSSFARYVPTGYLVFLRKRALWAVRFAPSNKAKPIVGEPFPVESKVGATLYGGGQFALSDEGTFAFISGASPLGLSKGELFWIDRQGNEKKIGAEPQFYDTWSEPRLSPDGKQVAVKVSGNGNLLSCDLDKKEFSILTDMKGHQFGPLWDPVEKRIIFGNQDPVLTPDLYWQLWDRSDEALLLYKSPDAVHATSLSSSLRVLLLRVHNVRDLHVIGTSDIWQFQLKDKTSEPWYPTEEINESGAEFSPDDKCIAYTSNEEGQNEVFIRRFPAGEKLKVSIGGGSEAAWGPSKEELELFYRDGKNFMRVQIQTEPELKASIPESLFEDKYLRIEFPDSRNYDISKDGTKFLVIKTIEEATRVTQINIVVNWFDKLKQIEASVKQ